MTDTARIKRTYTVTKAVDTKLGELAKAGERDKSAQLRVLVNDAYRKMQALEQAHPSE